MIINNYTLSTELTNANSGFSKWGFAKRGQNEYFIKELLHPVYPMDRSVIPPEMFEAERKACEEYEQRSARLFAAINAASKGNLVRILEFFRNDSKYYLVTEKVNGPILNVEQIAALPVLEKYMIMTSAAYAFVCLHGAGVVHFDVKPANIMIKRTPLGRYTAKLIDFDSGFLLGENRDDFELGGDLTYLAPETFLGIIGEEVYVDEKTDIFALGLVFHEFYTGNLPQFNTTEYDYPYEAVLDGGGLTLDAAHLPNGVENLLARMLDADAQNRPSALEVVNSLAALSGMHTDKIVAAVTPQVMPIHTARTDLTTAPPAGKSRIRTTFKTSTPTAEISAPSTTVIGVEAVPEMPTEAPMPSEMPEKLAGKWFSAAGDL